MGSSRKPLIFVSSLSLLSAIVVLSVACPDELPLSLESYCPSAPMSIYCPDGQSVCPDPYPCIGYCLSHFPNGGAAIEGLGAWCDDEGLPEYDEFCSHHPEVSECAVWCDSHVGECSTEADGDSDGDIDGDGDVDSDADGDVDGDTDADADADEADVEEAPECSAHTDCTDAAEAQCAPEIDECAPCENDDHCAHIDGLPACDDGACVICSETNKNACTEPTPLCLIEGNSHTCVGCLNESVCTTPEASRCDPESHNCAACETIDDCSHLTETPVCHNGTCVECTEASHCALINEGGQVCNHSSNRCVEACQECLNSDSQCENLGEGFHCVPADLIVVARQCMQIPHPELGCQRPWVEAQKARDGGSSSELVTVCVPPEPTSCLGLVEFGRGCELPGDPLQCGADEVLADGTCLDELYCTYGCVRDLAAHDEWCPEGWSCDTEDNVCRTD